MQQVVPPLTSDEITIKGVVLKLNKYVALGCGFYLSYLFAQDNKIRKQRQHIAKQLVYSPSIVQQSNRKLNDTLSTMTGQIKEYLLDDTKMEKNKNIELMRDKFEAFESTMSKKMKQIDSAIQKYYGIDEEKESEHIPVTFMKIAGKTTIKLNKVLVMGRIDPLPLPESKYILSSEPEGTELLYKKSYKEDLCINNMITSRSHPAYGFKEERTNSFKLNDSQKEMTVIVKNFNSDTIITSDCCDHKYTQKEMSKFNANYGALFASIILSPLSFYSGVSVGIQECEIGIKANGLFCLLGDLVFDSQSQSFKMDNLEFISRSKQAILDYYSDKLKCLTISARWTITVLSSSFILYFVLNYFQQIKKFTQKAKQNLIKTLLFLYKHL